MKILANDPIRNINFDFIDIDGANNLNATLTFRIDKVSIFPYTLNSNTQLRHRNSTGTRYAIVEGNNFSIQEFDDYYILTITNVNEF